MIKRPENFSQLFLLNGKGIDHFSAILDEKLRELEVERENRLRIRFSLEESLLRLRDRFGEDEAFRLRLIRRLGGMTLQLELEGEVFNPLSKTEVELEDWSGSLLTAAGISPLYSYSQGRNILRVNLPRKRMNDAIRILIAIAIGLAVGFIFREGLSSGAQQYIADEVLMSFYDLWIRLLQVLSGPVVFVMVCNSTLSTGTIVEEGGSQHRIIARYFLMSMAAALLAVIAAAIANQHMPTVGETMGIKAGDYLSYIVRLVPMDPISPFIETNSPQLMFMALLLGNGILFAGSRADGLSQLIRQGNMVGLQLTAGVCRCVPFFAALLIIMEMINNTMDIFRRMWLILLLSLLLSLVFAFIVMGYVSKKMDVPLGLLFQKLWPAFVTTLKTGSINEGFGQMERGCVRELGLEKHFATVSVPYALVLYMPINVIGTMVFTIFAALQYQVEISVGWAIIAMLLAVGLFVATPPVPGANLLAYIMIFNLLGVPSVALIDAMVFDILFGIFAQAANESLVQMDLILQANRLGLLKKDVLRGGR